MLPLFALLVLSAAPASSREPVSVSFKKTKDFLDWRAGRFLFEERWVSLPEAGLQVGYFLVPSAVSFEYANLSQYGRPSFEDAFFAVDSRTGRPVSQVVQRGPFTVCPAPGHVRELRADFASTEQAGVQFGNYGQPCGLRFRRTKDAWTASLFPDEMRSPEENFPEAARAMAKVSRTRDGGVGTLRWSYLPDSIWLLAASQERCALWAFDSINNKVDATASEAMTRKICTCLREAGRDETGGLELDRVARGLEWTELGTGQRSCACLFSETGEADVECGSPAGRYYSPATLAKMEADDPGLLEARRDAEKMRRMREGLESFQELVTTNRKALEAWKAGNQEAAVDSWVYLYRKWIALGRPQQEDAFGEMTEEVVSLLGQSLDVRHASIDQWVEILNNLGFAMWSRKEWVQAEAAYNECMILLRRSGRTHNVLDLNRGDLYRDMGKIPSAKEAYERFLKGTVTASQRQYVEQELKKLEKRSGP
ncbi:tetratricopeptide repeat protein [Hyalangium versicolor]|uniref:tetratricopeptide repeat protein n=1 Tax=Hyalangium versicolor TaxID=2861190 RepID=UPI001CCA0786|nr:tetratricopeptide repeat protein [Hyalangium versicolor]